jgi:hypothetical protein
MGWMRQWTSERAGEVPGRSPPRAGSVTLADHQLSNARIKRELARSGTASGAERARSAQPGHFTGALGGLRPSGSERAIAMREMLTARPRLYDGPQPRLLHLRAARRDAPRPSFIHERPAGGSRRGAATGVPRFNAPRSSGSPTIARIAIQETKRPRDQETKRPRDQETKRPRDQETKRPRDQETKRPRSAGDGANYRGPWHADLLMVRLRV